jgi:hypothetical protein
MFEAHSARRQPVNAGRFDKGMAVTAKIVVHIVHGNEQDIEFLRGRSGWDDQREGEQNKGEDLLHDDEFYRCQSNLNLPKRQELWNDRLQAGCSIDATK